MSNDIELIKNAFVACLIIFAALLIFGGTWPLWMKLYKAVAKWIGQTIARIIWGDVPGGRP